MAEDPTLRGSALASAGLLNALPDPVLVVDEAGSVVFASESAHRLLQRRDLTLAGQGAEVWLADLHGLEVAAQRALAAGHLEGKRMLRASDGTPIEVDFSARDARLEDGRRAIVATVRSPLGAGGRETTEGYQELLEAVWRNAERLAYATRAAEVGLFEHHFEPPEIWWSPSLRALLGYPAHSPPDFTWFRSRIHPEDVGILDAAVAAIREPTGNGRTAVECRFDHPNKGYRWLLMRSATIFDQRGEERIVEYSIGAILDVTERRVAEEDRLRRAAILEATPDLVVITDLAGRVIDLNFASRKLKGLPVQGIPESLNLEDFYTRDAADQLRDEIIPTAKADGVWSGETELRVADGRAVPASQVVLAHRDFAGELAYLSAIVRDLSKEKALEEQFRHAQKMEAVGRLAGGVAHDFNNLLFVIQGYAEMATRDLGENQVARRSLREIEHAADRAADLTRQLLAFGRRQILEPRVIDINETLSEFLPMISRLVDERIEVQVLSARQSVNIKADPNQLQQVLLNLAVNARDAMPDGGTLTVEAFRSSLKDSRAAQVLGLKAGSYTVIAVSDTGHGMDERTRESIFEPFFTTKGLHEGTGLGLSTVLGIVQQSGGNIWVYSEPGRGTTFKLYFPCIDEPAERFEPVSEPVLSRQHGVVLVAEDDDQVRAMVTNILTRAGLDVLPAADPEEALAMAARHEGRIDLLLTDVVMPKFSGAELAQRLKVTRPGIRVLYSSGYTENTIVHHGVLDEGVNFLPKPVTPGRLLAAVDRLLCEQRPQRVT